MKKTMIVFTVILSVFVVGCISRGRLAVIDLDLRDQSQIEAGKDEAAVIYQNESTNTNDVATAKSFDFSLLSSIISAIKGRIRVLSFEWNDN